MPEVVRAQPAELAFAVGGLGVVEGSPGSEREIWPDITDQWLCAFVGRADHGHGLSGAEEVGPQL
jgi:hypothetical protein